MYPFKIVDVFLQCQPCSRHRPVLHTRIGLVSAALIVLTGVSVPIYTHTHTHTHTTHIYTHTVVHNQSIVHLPSCTEEKRHRAKNVLTFQAHPAEICGGGRTRQTRTEIDNGTQEKRTCLLTHSPWLHFGQCCAHERASEVKGTKRKQKKNQRMINVGVCDIACLPYGCNRHSSQWLCDT